MQDEANHITELLSGEVNQEQAELLKLLLRNANNKPVLDKYLSINTVNKKTRDDVIDARSNLTTLEHNFYLLTEKIYQQIKKKSIPLSYKELVEKLKKTEAELTECRSVVVSLYTNNISLIYNSKPKLNRRIEYVIFKKQYEKYYIKCNACTK